MPQYLRFGIAIVCVILDQWTKIAAASALKLHETIVVLPMFNIFLAHNYGAAFSFLSDAGGWQRYFFTGISLVVSILLIFWLYKLTMREKWMSLAFALLLGGAVGNLIDRALRGYVVDFIQVYYDKWYFPTFNIADSAIFCGAALMLILTFFEKDSNANPATSSASNPDGQPENGSADKPVTKPEKKLK